MNSRTGHSHAVHSPIPVLPEPADNAVLRIRQLFGEAFYPCLRSLTCERCGGTVILRGEVPCYYLKQIAQTLVLEQVTGIDTLENRIQVVPEE